MNPFDKQEVSFSEENQLQTIFSTFLSYENEAKK